MSWIFLLAAGLVEVAWALSIEPTHCFTRPLPTLRCALLSNDPATVGRLIPIALIISGVIGRRLFGAT